MREDFSINWRQPGGVARRCGWPRPGFLSRRYRTKGRELSRCKRECEDRATARTVRAGRDYFLPQRSEEHTSELQSLMRISYAVFCLKKTNKQQHIYNIQ